METPEIVKALSRPIETICNLTEMLLSKPTSILGEIVGDQLRLWQLNNRVKILERANEIMRERGVEARELTRDFLIPFMRDSGDVSSSTLQETWARLLASAIEGSTNEHIAFINTLKNLTATDVQVLDCFVKLGYQDREKRVPMIAHALSLDEDLVSLSISNLEHLGFFTPTQKRLKGFAVYFLRACVCDRTDLERYIESQKVAEKTIVMD